jgi:hypothetical protein
MLSLVVLVAVIVVTGVMFYRVMIGFLLPLFLAAVLVVMFRPVPWGCWIIGPVGADCRVVHVLWSSSSSCCPPD